MFIPDPDKFFPNPDPDPGSRGQNSTGSRIRIRNTVFVYKKSQTCERKKCSLCDGGIEEELFDKKQQMGILFYILSSQI
jgi:hypothetical protein